MDEESAPLLGQTKTATDDAQTSKGSSQYGSVAKAPAEGDPDYEARKQKQDEDDRQRVEKGLQDSGNWFKYASISDPFTIKCTTVQNRLLACSLHFN